VKTKRVLKPVLFSLSVLLFVFLSCDNSPVVEEIVTLEKKMEIDGNLNLDNFFTPGSTFIDSMGRLFILDPVAMRILAFDKNGQFLFDFGRVGEAPGEFNFLGFNCAIDSRDIIYLINEPFWIEKYNSHGEYIETISPQVETINDIAVIDSTILVVNALALVNWDDYCPIIKLNQNGDIIDRFGSLGVDTEDMPGWERSGVSSCVLDVDEEGNVYYSSIVDYRLFKYDVAGELVYSVVGESTHEAIYERHHPLGLRRITPVVWDLCVSEDRVYVLWGQGVTESGYRVDVFDKDSGELLGYFFTQVPSEKPNVSIEVVDGRYFYTASYEDAVVYKFEMIY